MFEPIYIGNTQHTSKKIIDSHLYYLLRLLKNGQRPNSFDAHLEQHFTSATSRTEIRKYMTFKVLNDIKPIGAKKKITKSN